MKKIIVILIIISILITISIFVLSITSQYAMRKVMKSYSKLMKANNELTKKYQSNEIDDIYIEQLADLLMKYKIYDGSLEGKKSIENDDYNRINIQMQDEYNRLMSKIKPISEKSKMIRRMLIAGLIILIIIVLVFLRIILKNR